MSPNWIGDGSVTARLSYVIPENALGDTRSKNGRLGTSPRFLNRIFRKAILHVKCYMLNIPANVERKM